jgi:hypothetical protein
VAPTAYAPRLRAVEEDAGTGTSACQKHVPRHHVSEPATSKKGKFSISRKMSPAYRG